ncbi:MAG: tetratricopeptide repeat protein [Algoriphagus sp.]|uniref:tetratricopeptide repeat protein n=1 Tax=Algoriphagus sp. TaxID=1872435 RepID=UPI00179B9318|nr:tetratricopeptide repeat protein [Algoriphagus sp.]NVJ85779.1 tetratricopeptide repeat protein [Algoriphagus sp.]
MNQRSIAVLPFDNLSSDLENEYFSDGIAEEIINALSKIQSLKVIARTSSFAFKGQKIDVRIIGNKLGVSSVIEGSIRKAGNRVRIAVQLIRTDNGFHIWSETFDRTLEDIFDLQDEISLLVADRIRENFGHLEIEDHLVTAHTKNFEAYSLYLKGRFHQLRWNFNEFDDAIEAFEKSTQLDPMFYQPHFGLVQCYGLKASWGAMDKEEGLKKADYHLKEGVRINNQTTEAHFALATKSLWVNWNPYEALDRLKLALSINPNDPESLESAAEAHIALGQFDEAENFIKSALDVNPLSANHHFTIGNIYYLQKDFSTALTHFQKSLEIDPTWEFSIQVSALCYIFLNDKKNLDELQNNYPNLTEAYLFPHLFHALNNGKPIDLKQLPKSEDIYFPWSLWKLIYAEEKEEAFDYLLTQLEVKRGQYLNFLQEPLNHPITRSEEFQPLIPQVFDQPSAQSHSKNKGPSNILISEKEQQDYLLKLKNLMQGEHLYTKESLTLRNLAEAIDLHPNRLSWLIKEAIGKNFNEYINGFRVEAFKKKALDPSYHHYTLLGIAYECGFRTKSVFNDFFKKSEGLTPSAWLKKQRK